MRRHPEIVARALLMGVEPLNFGYDMPSHVLAAERRMWREAEKDPQLKPYLPAGGLMAAASEVLRRLERHSVKVKVKNKKTVHAFSYFRLLRFDFCLLTFNIADAPTSPT